MNNFKHVDALRGIAVLLVVLVHFGQLVPPGQIFGFLSKFGQYGVQLFFVMSAFTLCHSMKKVRELNSRSYSKFLIRRFFRIAPLYYLAIPLYFLFSYICLKYLRQTPYTSTNDYTIKAVLSNVLFVHGLYQPGNNTIVPGGWLIGAEFLFYATFPFVYVWALRRRIIIGFAISIAFVATIILVLLQGKIARMGEIENNGFVYFSVFNQYPCFAIGMLYYFYSKNNRFRLGIAMLAPLGVICIVLLHDRPWGLFLTPLFAGISSVGMAQYFEYRTSPDFLSKVGRLSFSIYILHFIPVWFFGKVYQSFFPFHLKGELVSLIIYIFIVGITYAISLVSNMYIELPFISLGQKLSNNMKEIEAHRTE